MLKPDPDSRHKSMQPETLSSLILMPELDGRQRLQEIT